MLAPIHPEGDEGGLVGSVIHAGIHPHALPVLAQVRSTNPLTSAGGLPLVFTHKLCRFYCKSISLWKVEETQAPNHKVIGLHDGAIEAELRDFIHSNDHVFTR